MPWLPEAVSASRVRERVELPECRIAGGTGRAGAAGRLCPGNATPVLGLRGGGWRAESAGQGLRRPGSDDQRPARCSVDATVGSAGGSDQGGR